MPVAKVVRRAKPRQAAPKKIPAPEQSASDENDYSSEEDEKDYGPGGYHRVQVGQTYHDRFRVMQKLGWGHFSTVWQVWDMRSKQYYAMKVQKSARRYREAAEDEIEMLQHASKQNNDGEDTVLARHCVSLVDSFKHSGPNGQHVCMVFEMLGVDLLALIKASDYNLIRISLIKRIATHVLAGLKFMHQKCGLIHTDLKPENVMASNMARVILPPHPDMLKSIAFAKAAAGEAKSVEEAYGLLSKQQKKRLRKKLKDQAKADTEGAESGKSKSSTEQERDSSGQVCEDDSQYWKPEPPERRRLASKQFAIDCVVGNIGDDSLLFKLVDFGNACWDEKHFTDDIQTRQYRSPEVIIGACWDNKVDIWSAACTFWELATGDFLFDARAAKDGAFTKEDDHLALMVERLGPIPKAFALSGEDSKKYFHSNGDLKRISMQSLRPETLEDRLVRKYCWHRSSAQQFCEFLLPMLEFIPERRCSAAQALEHAWLQHCDGQDDVLSNVPASGQEHTSDAKHESSPTEQAKASDGTDVSQ